MSNDRVLGDPNPAAGAPVGPSTPCVVARAFAWATAKVYFIALASAAPGVTSLTPLASAVRLLALVVVLAPRGCTDWLAHAYVRLPSFGQAGVVTRCLLIFAAVGGSTTSFIYFQF